VVSITPSKSRLFHLRKHINIPSSKKALHITEILLGGSTTSVFLGQQTEFSTCVPFSLVLNKAANEGSCCRLKPQLGGLNKAAPIQGCPQMVPVVGKPYLRERLFDCVDCLLNNTPFGAPPLPVAWIHLCWETARKQWTKPQTLANSSFVSQARVKWSLRASWQPGVLFCHKKEIKSFVCPF